MSDFLDWSTLIYRAPALLIAMALHEYAHAYVSDSLGDPTPSMQGRLTANPLVHLDMVGLMLLVVCGFGWAKPVEINPNYYKNFRSGVMKVSFAGPGMNLLSCGVGAFLANRLPWEGIYLFCGCSAILGFFNLLPALPLDGGVFLRAMLLRRGELERSDRVLTASSLAVGVLLLCAGTVLFVSSGGNCTLLVCAGAVLGRLVRNYFTPGRKSFIV